MIIVRRSGTRRLALVAIALAALASSGAWAVAQYGRDDAPAAVPSPTEGPDPLLPGGRSRLAVCASAAAGSGLDLPQLRDGLRQAIDAIGQEDAGWGKKLTPTAVVDEGCPGGHRPYPRNAISLSAGLLADGEFFGQRVSEPSPYSVFVFFEPGVAGGFERAPLEIQCQGAQASTCQEVTVALFVDPAATGRTQLKDALRYALGFGDARNPGSNPPGGSIPKATPAAR